MKVDEVASNYRNLDSFFVWAFPPRQQKNMQIQLTIFERKLNTFFTHYFARAKSDKNKSYFHISYFSDIEKSA